MADSVESQFGPAHIIFHSAGARGAADDFLKLTDEDWMQTIEIDLMDNVLPAELKVDFIKIDVEGAEFLVMEGGKKTIKKNQPIIVFEHGLGGSNHYGNGPDKVFDFFKDCKMNISNLDSYLNKKSPLSKEDFCNQYFKKLNYYFVAHP